MSFDMAPSPYRNPQALGKVLIPLAQWALVGRVFGEKRDFIVRFSATSSPVPRDGLKSVAAPSHIVHHWGDQKG